MSLVAPSPQLVVHNLQYAVQPLPLLNPRVYTVGNLSVTYTPLLDRDQIMIVDFVLNSQEPLQYAEWNWAWRGAVWEIFQTQFNPLGYGVLRDNATVSSTVAPHPVGSLMVTNTILRYSDNVNKLKLIPWGQVVYSVKFFCKRITAKSPQRFVFQSWNYNYSREYK